MIKLLSYLWKLNFKSVLTYRTSFIIQSMGMFFGDFFMLIIWYFFFSKFGKIGNMGFNEYIVLYTVVIFVYCFVHLFFGGYTIISRIITDGGLDTYLLLPKNTLFLILTSKISFSAFGDLFFGITLLFFIKNITIIFVLKLLLFSFFGSLVLLSFLIFFQSLGFFLGSSKEISKLSFDLLIGPAHYPPASFEKTFIKTVFLTIIPVYFSFFYPFELLYNFDYKIFLSLVFFGILYIIMVNLFFKRGLKKYESGNITTFVS